jgi:tetratricopeptide (TPR) repeat protein
VSVSDVRVDAGVLYEEAVIRRAEGNTTGAIVRYTRVLAIAEQLGDEAWRAQLLDEIGQMYQEACDLLSAREWHGRALALYEERGEAGSAARVRLRLAQVEQLAGDLERSEALFREAAAGLGAAGEFRDEALARAGLGQLLCEVKRSEEGVREMIAGLRRLDEAGEPDLEPVRGYLREYRSRVGSVRYRELIEAATDDPPLRSMALETR